MNCDGENLHPLKTYLFHQNDGMGLIRGLEVRASGSNEILSRVMSQDEIFAIRENFPFKPRCRELDTVMTFYCETCEYQSQFSFFHHKGCTLVGLKKILDQERADLIIEREMLDRESRK